MTCHAVTEVNHGEGPHFSVSLSLVIYSVIVICLPTKHLGVLMNSFQNVSVRSRSNWNLEVLIFEERGNRSNRIKTSRSKGGFEGGI